MTLELLANQKLGKSNGYDKMTLELFASMGDDKMKFEWFASQAVTTRWSSNCLQGKWVRYGDDQIVCKSSELLWKSL